MKIKRTLSILMACVILMMAMPMAVAAEGTQDNPINANDKWFGYGVDIFLLNPTLEAGDTDGIWYELTADAAGILQVEHSVPSSAPIAYQITVNVNGQEYLGYENGTYNMPVVTLPVAVGDVISIHIIAQDTSVGGLVYVNAKFITGENDMNQMVKLKGPDTKVWVAAGQTVYFQDDSLQASYAAKGLLLKSSVNGKGITVLSNNKAYTDTDADGIVELKLGGSAGSAGAPPVKPSFAIVNESGEDAWFVLNVADDAHECVYDDTHDTDCNQCGAIREVSNHVYSHDYDAVCNVCEKEKREVTLPVAFTANSISEDVNGLAFLFDITVANMQVNRTTAIYDNATVGGYKLVGMGVVASNNGIDPTLCDVENVRVLKVPAVYLYDMNGDVVTYAVRFRNIPDEQKDTTVIAVPYFVIEVDGVQHTVYGEAMSATYNGVASR